MISKHIAVEQVVAWCRYRWDWLLSVALHILLFLALIIITTWQATPTEFNLAGQTSQQTQSIKVIQAQTISAQALDNELDRIAEIKRQKALAVERAAAERRAAIRRREEAVLAAKRAEAKRLAELKAQREAQQRAAELKAQQLAEQKKLAAAKAKQAEAAKQQAAIKKLQALGVAGLNQAVQQEQAQQAAAQRALTEKQKYIALIQQIIRGNWINQFDNGSGLSVTLRIQLDSQGDVLNVAVVKSSGDKAFDRQAVLATRKSSPLPLPQNQQLAGQFSDIVLSFGG